MGKRWFAAILVLALALSMVPTTALAAAPAVSLALDRQVAAVGEVVKLTVSLTGGVDVYGAAVDVVFDPAFLDFVLEQSAAGSLVTGGVQQVYTRVFARLLEGTPSRSQATALALRLGPQPGASGSGTLAVLAFRVRREGEFTFALDNSVRVQLVDSAGNPITLASGTAPVTLRVGQAAIDRIDIEPWAVALAPGQQVRFTARGLTREGYEVPGLTFQWTVEPVDTGAGSIDTSGVFTAREPGTVRVVASVGDIRGTATVIVAPPARFALVPSTPAPAVGTEFTVDVRLENATAAAGASFILTFPATHLAVVDADGVAENGVQVQPGSFLTGPAVIQNVDNEAGRVAFAIAPEHGTPQSGGGVLATIRFRAKERGPVRLQFISTEVRTLLDDIALEMPHERSDLDLTLLASGTIKGKVALQGRRTGLSGVTVKVVGTPLVATTDDDGTFVFQEVPAGTYTLLFKRFQYLNRAVDSVAVTTGGTADVGTVQLRGGDADGDNAADLRDLIILAKTFNKAEGDAGYDARADFNGDRRAGLADLIILASNFDRVGSPDPHNP